MQETVRLLFQFVLDAIENHLYKLNEDDLKTSPGLDAALFEPGLWPFARPTVEEWTMSPVLATVQNECVLVAHMLNLISNEVKER